MKKLSKSGWCHESTYNESKEWYTPRKIFDALGLEFSLDVCSPGPEIVPWIPAKHHITLRSDGLVGAWWGNVWMNPPYGSDTPLWMQRLMNHGNGLALVFARTDTAWFHDYVPKADAVCFIKGRVQFVPADEPEIVKDKKTGLDRPGIKYASLYAKRLWEPTGGCGAASMLVAYGKENADALFRSGLGLSLRVKQ